MSKLVDHVCLVISKGARIDIKDLNTYTTFGIHLNDENGNNYDFDVKLRTSTSVDTLCELLGETLTELLNNSDTFDGIPTYDTSTILTGSIINSYGVFGKLSIFIIHDKVSYESFGEEIFVSASLNLINSDGDIILTSSDDTVPIDITLPNGIDDVLPESKNPVFIEAIMNDAIRKLLPLGNVKLDKCSVGINANIHSILSSSEITIRGIFNFDDNGLLIFKNNGKAISVQ